MWGLQGLGPPSAGGEAAWVTDVQLIIGALWSTGVVGSGAVAEAAKAPDTVRVVGSDGA
jgi:hypothetical protein